jgi:hypothetical protein
LTKTLQAEPKRSSAAVQPQRVSTIALPDEGRIASLALEEEAALVQRSANALVPKVTDTNARIAGMVPKRLADRARQIRMQHRLSDSSMIEEGLNLLFESKTDEEVAEYLRAKGHRLRRA